MPSIFLIFLVVPLIEVYLFVGVGGYLGVGWTLFLVVLTAVVGAWLVRIQGLSVLMRFRDAVSRGDIPALPLVEGLFLLVAGALLITPGFFTDLVGFACLTPPDRAVMIHRLLKWGRIMQPSAHPARQGHSDNTIDADYRRLDD